MKKSMILSLVLALGILATGLKSSALECSNFQLSCQLTSVNMSNGSVIYGPAVQSAFVAFNDDEPSLPATECEARVSFPAKNKNQTFHASVQGVDAFTSYLYVMENFGVIGPQFETGLILGQKIQISHNYQTVTCELVNPKDASQELQNL